MLVHFFRSKHILAGQFTITVGLAVLNKCRNNKEKQYGIGEYSPVKVMKKRNDHSWISPFPYNISLESQTDTSPTTLNCSRGDMPRPKTVGISVL